MHLVHRSRRKWSVLWWQNKFAYHQSPFRVFVFFLELAWERELSYPGHCDRNLQRLLCPVLHAADITESRRLLPGVGLGGLLGGKWRWDREGTRPRQSEGVSNKGEQKDIGLSSWILFQCLSYPRWNDQRHLEVFHTPPRSKTQILPGL